MPRARILLADPNASMLAMTTELLGEEFEVVGAVQTGADTLRCLSETQPDLIVLDVILSDMNGFELGKRLQERVPGTRFLYLSMYEGPAVSGHRKTVLRENLADPAILEGLAF